MTKHVKHDYPEIPVVVLGHSMGSFVLRNYLKKYSTEIDGAIIMGTAGYKSELGVGLKLAQLLARLFPKNAINNSMIWHLGHLATIFPTITHPSIGLVKPRKCQKNIYKMTTQDLFLPTMVFIRCLI